MSSWPLCVASKLPSGPPADVIWLNKRMCEGFTMNEQDPKTNGRGQRIGNWITKKAILKKLKIIWWILADSSTTFLMISKYFFLFLVFSSFATISENASIKFTAFYSWQCLFSLLNNMATGGQKQSPLTPIPRLLWFMYLHLYTDMRWKK